MTNRKWIFTSLIALMALTLPAAQSQDDLDATVREANAQSAKAARVFDEIMKTPDSEIPRDLLDQAKAIAVFPKVIKAAFVVGGEGGRGVVSRRTSTGWSDPVFFRAGGGSVGLQAGLSSTDIVLLFMNDDAVRKLMKDKFELGADAGVAAGPVGREASADTDVLTHAEILSYSRSRGLFAGVNLKGVLIRPENELNIAVYRKTAHELLGDDSSEQSAPLPGFSQMVSRYSTSTDTDLQP
jgi:SH3 domain-containing YSC84-like protein 1